MLFTIYFDWFCTQIIKIPRRAPHLFGKSILMPLSAVKRLVHDVDSVDLTTGIIPSLQSKFIRTIKLNLLMEAIIFPLRMMEAWSHLH